MVGWEVYDDTKRKATGRLWCRQEFEHGMPGYVGLYEKGSVVISAHKPMVGKRSDRESRSRSINLGSHLHYFQLFQLV